MEWRASHILVKDKRLADELLRRIKQGASFEALARENSTCPSKSKGGDLGWFGPGKMVSGLRGRLQAPVAGVPVRRGLHLVRLPPHQADGPQGVNRRSRGARPKFSCIFFPFAHTLHGAREAT